MAMPPMCFAMDADDPPAFGAALRMPGELGSSISELDHMHIMYSCVMYIRVYMYIFLSLVFFIYLLIYTSVSLSLSPISLSLALGTYSYPKP